MIPATRDELIARLPLDDVTLEAELARSGFDEATSEFVRRANRNAGCLAALPRPASPAVLASLELLASPEFLAGIYERASATSRARVEELAGPLASAFTPLQAPRDVDWAAAVLERYDPESLGGEFAAELAVARPATPGWLWLRIRGEVRASQGARRVRSLQRVAAILVVGLALGAAAIGLWPELFGIGDGPGSRSSGGRSVDGRLVTDRTDVAQRIVIHRVEQPFDASFSLSAIVGEVRRGRR